uniref:28S ribosomal protein S34, mitochondrial n=1 Tax=Panagrellus redivivus TaxID=6233 RepID=A0A7E4W345_PANRE
MSVPSAVDKIRFLGNHDFSSQGKFMWEILCQLRNLGQGRIVTKNEWLQKWPTQPSYLKIVKARPGMDRWLQTGVVWVEWTFRGRNLGIYEFSRDLHRSDWRLVHKHEEAELLNNKNAMEEMILPDSFPLPPLQVLLAKKDAQKNNQPFTEAQTRAPLELSIDPQFAMLKPFIKQAPVTKKSHNIYDEVDPEALLDLYGEKLPVKVESWTPGPAGITPRFHIPQQ